MPLVQETSTIPDLLDGVLPFFFLLLSLRKVFQIKSVNYREHLCKLQPPISEVRGIAQHKKLEEVKKHRYKLVKIVTTPTQPQLNVTKVGFDTKMT